MMLRLACILDLLRKSFCWSIVALTRCSNPHVHLGTLRSCASRRLPLDSAKKTYARGLIFQLFLFQPVLAQPDIENFLNAFSDEPITQAVVQKKLRDGQYDQEFRHLIENAFSCAEAYAKWSKSTPSELFKAFLKLNLSPQLLVASCDFAFAERENFIAKFSLSYCNQDLFLALVFAASQQQGNEVIKTMSCALPHLFRCFDDFKMADKEKIDILVLFLRSTFCPYEFARFYGNLVRLFTRHIRRISAHEFLCFLESFAFMEEREMAFDLFLEMTKFRGLKLNGLHLKARQKFLLRYMLTSLIRNKNDLYDYIKPLTQHMNVLFEGLIDIRQFIVLLEGSDPFLRDQVDGPTFKKRVEILVKHAPAIRSSLELQGKKNFPLICLLEKNFQSYEDLIN